MSARVRTTLTLWSADRPEAPIAVTALYQVTDPYAVRLVFPGLPEPWFLARALLVDGLEQPAGEGDVRVAPAEADGWIEITLLPGQDRECRLFVLRVQLASFVTRCCRLVPVGREGEWIDWNRQIALLRQVTS
ncbi:SsgA family sporulation/cell division regulator [Sphaerisporangium rhizosphaerae]|uniref:SsgA family sporulation/cell division regulator n=1 Tax=Sphaerisporangium rhizosphaerae TaxID=2269375 RepID=A0ABW2P176_9ACTN